MGLLCENRGLGQRLLKLTNKTRNRWQESPGSKWLSWDSKAGRLPLDGTLLTPPGGQGPAAPQTWTAVMESEWGGPVQAGQANAPWVECRTNLVLRVWCPGLWHIPGTCQRPVSSGPTQTPWIRSSGVGPTSHGLVDSAEESHASSSWKPLNKGRG